MKLPQSVASIKFMKKFCRDLERSGSGDVPSAKQIERSVKRFFKRDFEYIEYEEVDGVIKRLLCVSTGYSEVDEPLVRIWPAHMDYDGNLKVMRAHLKRIHQRDKRTSRLSIVTMNFQKGFCRDVGRLGFRVDAKMFRGKIKPALEKLKKRINPNMKISYKKFSYNRDWKELFKIKMASAKEGIHNCRVDFRRKAGQELSKKLWKTYSTKSKYADCVVAYQGKELVGAIMMMYHSTQPKRALVCTVTINPKFQGQGLSYGLYYEAFLRSVKMKKTFVDGGTTTEAVERLSKRIGRVEFMRRHILD